LINWHDLFLGEQVETSSQDLVESFLLESTSHEHQNSQENHPPIQAPLSTGLVQNEWLKKKSLC
jgi:hypothetical protein